MNCVSKKYLRRQFCLKNDSEANRDHLNIQYIINRLSKDKIIEENKNRKRNHLKHNELKKCKKNLKGYQTFFDDEDKILSAKKSNPIKLQNIQIKEIIIEKIQQEKILSDKMPDFINRNEIIEENEFNPYNIK